MVLCLREPPGCLCDVGCCCCCSFPQRRFLHFGATFPSHQHSTLAFQTSENIHQLWALPWLLLAALLLPGFSDTVLPRALRFWVSIFFTHRRFFTLLSFLDIFGMFCDSDAGKNAPSKIILCACPHRFVPSGWCMDLNYSYCSYKINWLINCASELRSIELKLNYWICFTCSKSYVKTITKHFEQGLIKVLLKTAWTKLHIKVILEKQPLKKQPSVI